MKKSVGSALLPLLVLLTLFRPLPLRATTRYVDVNSATPTTPYTNWSTAATNIQDAVDAAVPGDQILVTSGVYRTGGLGIQDGYGNELTNRVAITNPVTVMSINGPGVTAIEGYQVPSTKNGDAAVRCVYLVNGCTLMGFTLTSGATGGSHDVDGGGVWCESSSVLVSNCVLIANSAAGAGGGAYSGTLMHCLIASNSSWFMGGGVGWESILKDCLLVGNSVRAPGSGGGATFSTLTNCTLIWNTASDAGGAEHCYLYNCMILSNSASHAGGAWHSTLNSCTVVGNTADRDGGFDDCGLNNSIVYFNAATYNRNYDQDQVLFSDSVCTIPLPYGGSGHFTNAPLFVDLAGGNLRLQSNSPCINAGNNANLMAPSDLDGRSRISGGTVDIGAYEYQGPGTGEFFGWLEKFGLRTDGSADSMDADFDGLNNWQEWKADTIPTNTLSVFKTVVVSNATPGLNIAWQSVASRSYFIERATNLAAAPPFALLATNLAGLAGMTTFTDTNAVGSGPFFYRVGVQ